MKKFLLFSIAASSVAVAQVQTTSAPMPQSIAGVVRLNRAPVSTEALKTKLTRPVEKTLVNGARLLILENHRAPSITLRMSLPAGALRDPEGAVGVADATASVIRMGTKTKNGAEIN